jgi:hypothetical protein
MPFSNELAFVFMGTTNNPKGWSGPPPVVVVGDGQGWHALFAATNLTTNHCLYLGIDRIEEAAGDVWVEHKLSSSLPSSIWSPGYSCLYAVPWPDGLPTNRLWRMNLWVRHEPPVILNWVNQRLNREVFPPRGRSCATSSLVTTGPSGVSLSR